MFDVHERLYGANAPLVFGIIPVYSFFVGLGILAGLLYYFTDLKRRNGVSEGAVKIFASALIFGIIGSKIPLLFEHRTWQQIMFGKSIVGALLGGMFGVIFIKKLFKIKLKLGNIIAPAVSLGVAIGRFGCFFNGCCYGKISSWGFDFGDGSLRLPTQLFESAFNFIAFGVLLYFKPKVKTSGILFKAYLLAYLIFRFFIEFIRDNPIIWGGLSIYQIICILGIFYVGIALIKGRNKNDLSKLQNEV